MDHYKGIYSHHAGTYHRLIEVEDIDNNLLPAMEVMMPLAGKKVLDLGSGTGRIPLLLNKHTRQIVSLDIHRAMLVEQQRQRKRATTNWGILQGDMRFLPFPDDYFEAVTAGWAIGHFVGWYQKEWQIQIERVIQEMTRVVSPGGFLIIIETLTTGSLVPAPPSPALADYYTWLEREWCFNCQQIQTDYQFQNIEEAAELTNFFFGEELKLKVIQNDWVRLPEWTGVWGMRTTDRE